MRETGKEMETTALKPEDKKQKGFTLVELVAVIAVLGILAAVALPKFMGIQGEARAAVTEGARGNLASAALMAHAKMTAANSMTVHLGDYVMAMSDWTAHYPKGKIAGHIAGLNFLSGHDGHTADDPMDGWQYFAPSSTISGLTNAGVQVNADVTLTASQTAWASASAVNGNQAGCYVKYEEATLVSGDITEPTITTFTGGCKSNGM